jgi:hypothetical protein
MTNSEITYVVGGACAVAVLLAFGLLVVRPAWQSYSRPWERIAATFLSLYVLATFVGIGVAGGLAITWFWDEL